MPCKKACKILSGGEFVTNFYFGSGTIADERTRNTMLVGVCAYKVRRVSCLWAGVLGFGGELKRCTQECWGDAWELRHAYLSDREASARSLLLV